MPYPDFIYSKFLLLEIGFRMLDSKIPLLSIREPYAPLIMEGKRVKELETPKMDKRIPHTRPRYWRQRTL
jgi:hypothetical protein